MSIIEIHYVCDMICVTNIIHAYLAWYITLNFFFFTLIFILIKVLFFVN